MKTAVFTQHGQEVPPFRLFDHLSGFRACPPGPVPWALPAGPLWEDGVSPLGPCASLPYPPPPTPTPFHFIAPLLTFAKPIPVGLNITSSGSLFLMAHTIWGPLRVCFSWHAALLLPNVYCNYNFCVIICSIV